MYYKHGTLRFLDKLLRRPGLFHYNNIQTRFQLCVDYVRVLAYLHDSPIGVRVMCDTPFLEKLLDQYLITDDFHLVVNDVDGLEEVTKQGACHKRPANDSLQSPMEMESQGLPTAIEPLNFQLRPAYDEKIDIWKIPWVVEKLLGSVKWSSFAKSELQEIMEKCHAVDPRQRPSASEVLQEMLRVQELLSFSKYSSLDDEDQLNMSQNWMTRQFDKIWCYGFFDMNLVAVSRLRKTVAKVFKNGRESLWDASLNEPFLRLIRILVSDWAHKMFLCPFGGQHLSRCFRDLLIRGTNYLQTLLYALPLWLVDDSFLQKEFWAKMGPTKPKKSH